MKPGCPHVFSSRSVLVPRILGEIGRHFVDSRGARTFLDAPRAPRGLFGRRPLGEPGRRKRFGFGGLSPTPRYRRSRNLLRRMQGDALAGLRFRHSSGDASSVVAGPRMANNHVTGEPRRRRADFRQATPLTLAARAPGARSWAFPIGEAARSPGGAG